MTLSKRYIALVSALAFLTTISSGAVHFAFASPKDRVNPKRITSDLDDKDSDLAAEEAALLDSMSNQAEKKDVKEEARASVDLKKAAEAIAEEQEPAPVKEQPAQKIEVVEKRDDSLKDEVVAMGNLFNQWQKDFEGKYAEVLETQQQNSRAVDERLSALEERRGSVTVSAGENEDQSVLIAELRKELIEKQEGYDSRLDKLEKSKQPAAHDKGISHGLEKINKEYGEIKTALQNQEQSLKAARLADGQLKQRMSTTEAGLNDTVREINSVKQSVTRIETNINELSEQLLESLKYRPHAVYQAPSGVDEIDYDWNAPAPRYVGIPHNAVMSDMPMVTVTEEVANLWSGPGEDDKIVTTIRRGAQLAVESTEQDWYRVIVADGRRAWIPARSVIHNNPIGRDTTLRIASAE